MHAPDVCALWMDHQQTAETSHSQTARSAFEYACKLVGTSTYGSYLYGQLLRWAWQAVAGGGGRQQQTSSS